MKDKKIIVGVTGGIAAYKAAELVRLLVKSGARTRVAMTAGATRFVAPLTFEALSGHRVLWDMFNQEGPGMDHIKWGQEADLMIIAPATAHMMAKMAHGLADDFLSSTLLAATAKVLVCPSMNVQMLMNPAVQANMELLRQRGYTVMAPDQGDLACGTEGPGRLPDPRDILEQAWMMVSNQDLSGLDILVTAGPTVEPLDPVRYISNRSTGKMGYALARAARQRGASVTLVSGPTALNPPYGVTLVRVKTALEMKEAVFDRRAHCHAIVKAAAVSDYRPRERAGQKIKKGAETLGLDLVKNPDILAELGAAKGDSSLVLVGFAAETQSLLVHAQEKLKAKNLDMIVANDVSGTDAGFESDTNRVKILYRDGKMEESPLMSKDEVAHLVLERVRSLVSAKGEEG